MKPEPTGENLELITKAIRRYQRWCRLNFTRPQETPVAECEVTTFEKRPRILLKNTRAHVATYDVAENGDLIRRLSQH